MKRMKNTLAAAILASALLAGAGCGKKDGLRVDNAVVTLSPVDTNPSVLHFDVHGGENDVKLLSIFSGSAIRTELHESKMDPETRMMTMEKLRSVTIPAGEKVEFKKGGLHGMVYGVNQLARRTGEMEYEFVFSNRDRILVTTVVQETDGTVPDERKALTE